MDFDKLYADHFDQVKRTAKYFLKNEEDALDATQDTFVSLYEHMDDYDHSSSLSTWITQICINKCKDKLRKIKRERQTFVQLKDNDQYLLDSIEDSSTPDTILSAEEDTNAVINSFSGLPSNIRKALHLRLVEDRSYKDIAAAFDIPVNTAKTWVRRGRKNLLSTISP